MLLEPEIGPESVALFACVSRKEPAEILIARALVQVPVSCKVPPPKFKKLAIGSALLPKRASPSIRTVPLPERKVGPV